MTVRQVLLDAARPFNESDTIIMVLLDARRDSKDIRIKNNVFGRQANRLRQELVGSLTDLKFPVSRVRLTLCVESHNDDGCTIGFHLARLFKERFFTFFQRNRINDRLALHTFQTGFDDVPFGRVNHHWHTGDIRFRCDEIQEAHHCSFRVQHALIHIHIDDLCTTLHLLKRNSQSSFIIILENEFLKFG